MPAPSGSRLRSSPVVRAGALAVGYAVLFTLVHAPLPSDTGPGSPPPSAIVNAGLLPVAFILYAAFWFGLLALAYWWGRLGATASWRGGLPLGLFAAGLVTVLYLEPLPKAATLGATNLLWLAADALPLVAFGPLLSRTLPPRVPSTPITREGSAPAQLRTHLPMLLSVAIVVLAVRVFNDVVTGIQSDIAARPVETVLWSLALGAALGAGYTLFRAALVGPNLTRSSLAGAALLAAIYLPFNFAYLLVADVGAAGVLDFGARLGGDVLAAFMAILLVEWLWQREEGLQFRPRLTAMRGPA